MTAGEGFVLIAVLLWLTLRLGPWWLGPLILLIGVLLQFPG